MYHLNWKTKCHCHRWWQTTVTTSCRRLNHNSHVPWQVAIQDGWGWWMYVISDGDSTNSSNKFLTRNGLSLSGIYLLNGLSLSWMLLPAWTPKVCLCDPGPTKQLSSKKKLQTDHHCPCENPKKNSKEVCATSAQATMSALALPQDQWLRTRDFLNLYQLVRLFTSDATNWVGENALCRSTNWLSN